MHWVVKDNGQSWKVRLPDQTGHRQIFTATVNGKVFECAADFARGVVTTIDSETGVEQHHQLRQSRLQNHQDSGVFNAYIEYRRSGESCVQPLNAELQLFAPGLEQRRASQLARGSTVRAPINGKVIEVLVNEGDIVAAGATLLIVEAMKMENKITAVTGGRVESLKVSVATLIQAGQELATIKPDPS